MEKKEPNHKLFLFLLIGLGGLAAIVFSMFPTLLASVSTKGVRSIGFSLLFIAIGEWLNHPVQRSISKPDEHSDETETLIHRKRNPCGLGNVFDVFGIILIFIALSLFLFPD